jgi:hypothetical protein
VKLSVLILSILAAVGIIVGFIMFTSFAGAAAAHCTQYHGDQTALQQCVSQYAQQNGAASAGIGVLLMVAGSICGFVAWVLGLIKTATISRWGWFVAVFLLPVLGSLIYGAAGPDQRAM